MWVIGVADDKGNVIIEKTSSAGKTEVITMRAETVSVIQEFGKAVALVFQKIVQVLTPVFQQFAEEYTGFMNTVSSQCEQELADIAELMEQAAEVQEERRIRRETWAYQRKQCSRIRSRTQQQA